MKTTEFKVPIPEGMEIDKENSTFECIKFKPIKAKRWRDNTNARLTGYYITAYAELEQVDLVLNVTRNYNVFTTEKQAKSAIAMARISQIMANDERFGGVVTDEEWGNVNIYKYCIERIDNQTSNARYSSVYHFLAFHTKEQCDLFLLENRDLVEDYLMLK